MKRKLLLPLATLSIGSLLASVSPMAALATAQPMTARHLSSAEPTISSDQAVAIARKLLPIPPTYTVQNANYQTLGPGQSATDYTLYFQAPGVQEPPEPSSIQVAIDGNTGRIVQFLRTNPAMRWLPSNGMTQAKAEKIAEDWLKKLAVHADELTLAPTSSTGLFALENIGYTFQFVHRVHGIPVSFQEAQITLDKTGQLASYNYVWKDAILPNSTPVIPESIAENSYIQALGLHLAYSPKDILNYPNVNQVLTYSANPASFFYSLSTNFPQEVGPWIDASTGEVVDYTGQPIADSDSSAYRLPIVPDGPTQWPTALKAPLTQAQALQVAAKIAPQGDSWKESASQSVENAYNSPPRTIWEFNYSNSSNEGNVNIGVDSTTGMVLQYNAFSNPQSQPGGNTAGSSGTLLTDAQATAAATTFVEKIMPQLTGAIALSKSPMSIGVPSSNQSVSFTLLKNGIPVTSDGFSLNVDKATGQITSYFSSVDPNYTFPPATRTIPLLAAQAAYAKEYPVALEYVLPINSTSSDGSTLVVGSNTQPSSSSKAILVYSSNSASLSGYLDATTGKWTNYLGLPGATDQTPTDIRGHFGEEEMLEMAQNGVISLQDSKIHPDRAVTRGQFIEFLTKAYALNVGSNSVQALPFKDVSLRSPYYEAVDQALLQGFITPGPYFHPNDPITRIQAADILVRFLGWHPLSTQGNLFAVPFKDAKSIPTGLEGDVAIVNHYGLIPGVKGAWRPNADMTVADTSVAIVRAIRLRLGQ